MNPDDLRIAWGVGNAVASTFIASCTSHPQATLRILLPSYGHFIALHLKVNSGYYGRSAVTGMLGGREILFEVYWEDDTVD